MEITALLSALNSALAEPFALAWVSDSPRFLLVFAVIYAVVVIVAVTEQKNTRPGAEHGSAAWGDVFRLNKFYMDRHGSNLLLTQHFHIGIDGYKHKHNTNILIVGGSGAGKTRTYGVPNVLECACSMVITDPKSEILRKTGNLLKQKGYEVLVFDLINPAASFCYNPFVYVHDDREVLTLIENLIQNTTPSHSKSSDPFWEKSETALLQALMLYLLHEAPPEEQNFPMVMEMIAAAEVHEDDDNYQSPLDILFERLEMREPDSIACKQYRIFKQAAGKTAKSILVSVGVRLAAFNLPSIAKLTMTDELHLQELGERKIALFCCIPDSDKSLNYLVGMIYTQLIQTLYRQADRVHKGRLPVPVHCLMDEYANISLPKDTFLSALATMRSRAIFCSIIVQNMAQLKAMYKDDWESLVGLCDEFLYLGGTEKETHKYVSELLGKETISTTSYNQSKGRSGSYSINHQQSGRDLMTLDEVRLLDNSKCIQHDRQDIVANDGVYFIRWQDVLAVFSSYVSGDEFGSSVASLEEEQVDKLREIMWEMNEVDYSTHPETITIDTTDEDGNQATAEITETVLVIELTHKTPDEMAADYHFSTRQNTYLQLLQDSRYEELWAELLGGFAPGEGEVMAPDGTRVPTGTLQWPLPVAGTITSQVGHRVDPITGEVSSHTGTDIACAEGTPILAAADGTVTVANGLDSWGGSYGYYIQIDHGGGLETLYAHCSSICVTTGQQVQTGQVIGYVGHTGRATGNHLHLEVLINKTRADSMSFFT